VADSGFPFGNNGPSVPPTNGTFESERMLFCTYVVAAEFVFFTTIFVFFWGKTEFSMKLCS